MTTKEVTDGTNRYMEANGLFTAQDVVLKPIQPVEQNKEARIGNAVLLKCGKGRKKWSAIVFFEGIPVENGPIAKENDLIIATPDTELWKEFYGKPVGHKAKVTFPSSVGKVSCSMSIIYPPSKSRSVFKQRRESLTMVN